MGEVQMVCGHCESPINLEEAKRRYVEKYGAAPAGQTLGLCGCSDYVIDRDYCGRMQREKDARGEREENSKGKTVAIR